MWKRIFIIFIVLLFSQIIYAEDDVDAEGTIVLTLGQEKTIEIEGVAPFSADDNIATLEFIGNNLYKITGFRGGSTQILYWLDGVLDFINVEVKFPEILSSYAYGPGLSGTRPYFLYNFSSSSSFTDNKFYQNPSYAHTLNANSSLGKWRLNTGGSFTHGGQDSGSITSGQAIYRDPGKELAFGQTGAGLSRLGTAVLGGSGFFGSRFSFYNPFINSSSQFKEDLSFFGGVNSPPDLRDLNTTNQQFGVNYSITKNKSNVFAPGLINVSLFNSQHPNEKKRGFGGIFENNFHISDPFSLASGVYVAEGGIGATVAPVYQGEQGITSSYYRYIGSGLRGINAAPYVNDKHEYGIFSQHMLKNKKDIFSGSLSQYFDIGNEALDITSDNYLSSNIGWRHQLSYRSSYGANYNFSRSSVSAQSITNGLTVNFTHPASPTTYLSNSASYSRTGSTSNYVNLGSTWSLERKHISYSTGLSSSIYRGSSSTEGIAFSNSIQYVTQGISARLNVNYSKPNLRDDFHQIQIQPTLFCQPTSTNIINLMSDVKFQMGQSASTMYGSLNISYSHYFGPGVTRDTIIKKIFKVGSKREIEGLVFLDNNYNGYFDSGDRPLKGVNIILDGKKKSVSSDDGTFSFSATKIGQHKVAVDKRTVRIVKIDDVMNVGGEIIYWHTTDKNKKLLIPISKLRASVYVLLALDVNDNNEYDEEDQAQALSKLTLRDSTGREFKKSAKKAGVLFEGIEKGPANVLFDLFDMPENTNIAVNTAQNINIQEYKRYETLILFSPIRSLRGRIINVEGSRLPRGLIVKVGDVSSPADSDGFFWFKHLMPGGHPLAIINLPQSYCTKHELPIVNVGPGPYIQNFNIPITQKCPEPPAKPQETPQE